MRYIVGVDIGGTNIVVGTVAEDGSAVHGVRSAPTTPEDGPEAVLGADRPSGAGVHRRDAEKTAASRASAIVGVGIGSPGPLDRERGVVLLTPNLGWRDLPLRDLVSEAVGPSRHARQRRQLRDLRRMVGRRGARGARTWSGSPSAPASAAASSSTASSTTAPRTWPAKIGHTTIDSTGRLCKCGNYGCLEAYASGPAIAARAVEGIVAGVETRLPELAGGDLSKITARDRLRGGARRRRVRAGRGARHGEVPRRRRRQPGQHLQPRRGGRRRRRDHGRRPAVRAACGPRSSAARSSPRWTAAASSRASCRAPPAWWAPWPRSRTRCGGKSEASWACSAR